MAFTDSKPHYALLDGLRGVAALVVIWYHVFEGFATSPFDQRINHGYLAVDFFFILSGFVIGYAYDDRWKKMGIGAFFKRRLIRLHPMVILGAVVGVTTFCIQGGEQWDHTKVATSAIMLATLMSMFLIPSMPGGTGEVRGNGEIFPLNGPSWSLFFEYIANILYALILHRLPTWALRGVVILSGVGLAAFAVLNGSGHGTLGAGWSFADYGFLSGMLKVTFAFSMGLLLARNFRPTPVRGAFWICSAILVTLLAVPYIGSIAADDPGIGKPFTWQGSALWMNGLYDVVCIALVFPWLVRLGASGTTTDRRSTALCNFLGAISYPLYIIHYPFMYLFYTWRWNSEGLTLQQNIPAALLLFFGNIALAYAALKLYDEPLRAWLSRRFIDKKN